MYSVALYLSGNSPGDGGAIGTCFRRLCWGLCRPSKRRYMWLYTLWFLKLWWNTTWLYLGFVAVASAFLAEKVTGEPTVILLCVAMVLAVRDLGAVKKDKITSVLVVVLGVVAAFLAFPKEAEVGVWEIQIWAVVGVIIGASAMTVVFFVLAFTSGRSSQRKKRRSSSVRR